MAGKLQVDPLGIREPRDLSTSSRLSLVNINEHDFGNLSDSSSHLDAGFHGLDAGFLDARPPCRFYLQGYCSKGDRCESLHSRSPILVPNPKLTPPPVNLDIRGPIRKYRPDDVNRFASVPLEDLVGQFYLMCKDQHGCRYLQKKITENQGSHVSMIFSEVVHSFAELMMDPFGNYLCQKLFEYCSQDQKSRIVEVVAPFFAHVSTNMHGTRAAQKMVEFIANEYQIQVVTTALKPHVVDLIKVSILLSLLFIMFLSFSE